MNFDPPFPLVWIFLLALVAIAGAVWREIFGGRSLLPRWLHGACLLLRITGIVALLLVLLNPSRKVAEPETTGRTVVLLDASQSMNLAAEGNQKRWDLATEFAVATAQLINEEGISNSRIMTFSDNLDSAALSEDASGRLTNLSSALQSLLVASNEEVAEHIIVASDGRIHDRDRLGVALRLANAAQVPISTRVFGVDQKPRNARLAAVQAPRMVRPRSPISIHIDVEGSDIGPDEALTLKLTDDGGKVLTTSEFYLSDNIVSSAGEGRPSEQVLVFQSGLSSARYHLELSVAGEPEVDIEDNHFSFFVEMATGKLRVLFAEGTHWKRTVGHSGHCWNDMELMTRAWEESGDIEHVCLTPWSQYLNEPNLYGVSFFNGEMLLDRSKSFPKTRDELHHFDVLIVSDVPKGNFSEEQMQWVVDWVQDRGGGFLMGGGNTAFDTGRYDQSPWEKIVPVDMRSYGEGRYGQFFDIEIPPAVKDHPLWTVSPDPDLNEKILEAHPPFAGMNLVRRAKPGALVLAFRKGGDEPVIVAQRYGRGRSVAFMPDPNGGGGRFYLDWGPPESPVLSAEVEHISLGHGKGFRFNEAVAKADYGPEPSNPSPWYGQYWVNMIRWLGQNSVRWQRDKFAGRVVAAQAHPGESLALAAEVLSVSDIDQLLALDVGARIDGLAGRRVRLLYDRDRREFVGELSVPAELRERTEIKVLFDVDVGGEALSQSVAVGVHRGNPEFDQTAPDPQFLADLAAATGGELVASVDDAVEASRATSDRRRSESRRQRSEPLWSRWWPWLVFAFCFCLEWALRRRGGRETRDPPMKQVAAGKTVGTAKTTVAVLAAALCLALQTGGKAVADDQQSIEGLIEQLAAGKVRLRDEAQAALRDRPEAYDVLLEASQSHPSDEARIRAEKLVWYFKSHRWQLIAVRAGGHTDSQPGELFSRGLIVAARRNRIYTRARDHAREWNTSGYEPLRVFGDPAWGIEEDWLAEGMTRTLAICGDFTKLVTSNEYGEVILQNPGPMKVFARFSHDQAKPFIEARKPNPEGLVLAAEFLRDRHRLLIGMRDRVSLWNARTKAFVWTSELDQPAYVLATHPQSNRAVIGGDPMQSAHSLRAIDTETGQALAISELSTHLGGLTFDSTGTRLIGFGKDGKAWLLDFDQQSGIFSNPRSFGRSGSDCQGVAWGAKEASILATSSNPKQAMVEWDIAKQDVIWRSPPIEQGLSTPAWLGKDRLVVLGANGILTVWKFRGETE